MKTETPPRVVNAAFLDKISSGDTGQIKQANDAVNEFTRVRMRERGFARQILPPLPIANDDLDRQVDTDLPVKVVDKEPDSPAAQLIPFATLPNNRYINGPRYRVMFARIVTPRFTKDVDELRTYDMDIRQILSDNAIKDMLAEEDSKFLLACNMAMGGGVGQVVTETNSIHWKSISGGLSRSNLAEAKKVMPRLGNNRLEASTVLVNNITIKDVEKWQRVEIGGDLSEEILVKGFGEREFGSLRWIVTIKQDLVAEKTLYFFAEPKFLGKFFILEDTTMYLDRKAYMLEFFAYESIGAAIGNVAAVARVDFTVDYNPGATSGTTNL